MKKKYNIVKSIKPKQNENRIGPNNDTPCVDAKFLAARGKNKY